MQVYKIPLSINDVERLNLGDIIGPLVRKGICVTPSVILKEASQHLKFSDWFLNELDQKFDVIEIAHRKDRLYAVLSSKCKNEPGRLFLPLYMAASNTEVPRIESLKKSFPNLDSESIAVIQLLRDSFDSVDVERTFFGDAGGKATGVVDFGRAKKQGQDWQYSRVLFISLEGDTLMLRKDSLVAWCRLETGEVLEAGRFENAIIRYLQSVRVDDVFSSFTDSVLRTK
jgi:hypothetical protein